MHYTLLPFLFLSFFKVPFYTLHFSTLNAAGDI